jgi:hypothetical protein
VKTFRSRLGALLGLGAFLSPAQNAAAQSDGMIGSSLSAAQKTDFFAFFNFAAIREEKQAGGGQVTFFKPTGEAFRALVTLAVTTDSRGVILDLDLTVARSFIDDPKQRVYAADLAKSFLGSAATTTSGNEVDSLAREISARSTSTMIMLTSQPLPTVPATPSAAYQTYAGDSQPQTLLYPSGKVQVTLRNESQSGEPVLSMRVVPKPGT